MTARWGFIILFFLSLTGCSVMNVVLSDDPAEEMFGKQDHLQDVSRPDDPSHVVGGRKVENFDLLAKRAVLLITERNGKTSSCTAVPISEHVLLSAAHCVYGVQPLQVKAIFNNDMAYSKNAPGGSQLNVVDFKIHEDYDGTPQSKADLAVIKLGGAIPAGYQSVGLYDGKSTLSDDSVVMLGYGITDEKKTDSLVLRTTTKSYKSDVYVKEGLIGFNQRNQTGGFCRGDSGAPIYVNSGGKPKIIGINSFAVGTVPDRECHTASFAMYTPYFRSWILKKIIEL